MKIVIAEPEDFSPIALKKLEEMGTVLNGPFSTEGLQVACVNAEVLMIRLKHYISEKFIEACPSLTYILTPTTGLDHIDLGAAQKGSIEVVSLKGEIDFLEDIPSTAEYSWGLMLALVRKIPQAFDDVKKGNWERDKFKSRNLNTLTLGIIGFGRVGRQIAHYAKAFNMEWRYCDTDPEKQQHPNAVTSVEKLLENSDIVSVHIPYDDTNHIYLNKERLQYLKNGSYLINTSRGGIWDEKVIVSLLRGNTIAGVATDVLMDESFPEKREGNVLLEYANQHSNCIITPHIAGATFDSMKITEEFIVDKFVKLLSK